MYHIKYIPDPEVIRLFCMLSEYDQEMPQSDTIDQPMEAPKNDNSDMTFRTQQSKATSSLFPSEMIAKRHRTQTTKQGDNTQPSQTIGATTNTE